jgi:hypothetical protein
VSIFPIKRALAAALIITGVGVAAAVISTSAATDALAFELFEREVEQSQGATLKVRLVDMGTGKTVPDAVLFISQLDMSPDGACEMSAPLETVLPGYSRFETNPSMAGGWAPTPGAKAPGVTGAVQGRLIMQVVP